MKASLTRRGSVFLLGVLFVGSTASVTAAFLLMTSLITQRGAQSVSFTNQAHANAVSCLERALYVLRENASYAGNETYQLCGGECAILGIATDGSGNRVICAEGRAGKSVRRLETTVLRLQPTIRTTQWTEVPAFVSCP